MNNRTLSRDISGAENDLAHRNRIAGVVLGVIIAGCLGWWLVSIYFRPPTVSQDQLPYIQLLHTAVSSQNAEHINKLEVLLRSKHAEGVLPANAWKHFEGIIAMAKSDEWESAVQACRQFELAQQKNW